MAKLILAVALFAAIALCANAQTPDCVSGIGGKEKLIGKQFVKDGRRLSKNFVPFNEDADEVKESELNFAEYRVVGPTDGMTMDYRRYRVNIFVDDNDEITDVTCG